MNSLSPTSPAAPVSHRASGWWLLLFGAMGVFFLLAVLGVVATILMLRYSQQQAADDVQAEVARIQAAGEPITVADLYKFHRVSPGVQDITPFWVAALDSFDEKQFDSESLNLPIIGQTQPQSRELNDDDALTAADVFLNNYEATVQAALLAAKQQGECRFPVKFEAGFTAFLTHAQKSRLLARLFLLRSNLRSKHNDVEGAIESVDAILATSESLGQQRTLIEHLVRLAILGVALNETQRLLDEHELTEEQLARLQTRLEASDLQAGLERALVGERALNYLMFHNVETITGKQVRDNQQILMDPNGKLTRPADCLMSLSLFGDTIAASREPFPIALKQIALVETRLKALVKSRNMLDKTKYVLTALQFPAAHTAFEAEGRNLAVRDAVLIALAAERHRLKAGSYPAKLTQLVPDFLPAVPNDPFDGQALRIIVAENSLTIYSVGRDAKDDGGVQDKPSGEPDIVVQMRSRK